MYTYKIHRYTPSKFGHIHKSYTMKAKSLRAAKYLISFYEIFVSSYEIFSEDGHLLASKEIKRRWKNY